MRCGLLTELLQSSEGIKSNLNILYKSSEITVLIPSQKFSIFFVNGLVSVPFHTAKKSREAIRMIKWMDGTQ